MTNEIENTLNFLINQEEKLTKSMTNTETKKATLKEEIENINKAISALRKLQNG